MKSKDLRRRACGEWERADWENEQRAALRVQLRLENPAYGHTVLTQYSVKIFLAS